MFAVRGLSPELIGRRLGPAFYDYALPYARKLAPVFPHARLWNDDDPFANLVSDFMKVSLVGCVVVGGDPLDAVDGFEELVSLNISDPSLELCCRHVLHGWDEELHFVARCSE